MLHRVAIHLGYGKTGTTTLQRAYFDKLHANGYIFYLGMFLSDDLPECKQFFDALTDSMYCSDVVFDNRVERLVSAFENCIQHTPRDKMVVISNEHFLLSSFSARVPNATIRPRETARRLRRIFGRYDVRLIAGLRRQDALMHSIYVQTVSRLDHANRDKFASLDEYLEACLDVGHLYSEMYSFADCYTHFAREFEGAPWRVYAFENFVKDEAREIASITEFLGLDPAAASCAPSPLPDYNPKAKTLRGVAVVNQSPLYRALRGMPGMRSMRNKVLESARWRSLAVQLLRPPVTPYFTDSQRQRIRDAFREQNRELGERVRELQPLLAKYEYI